MPPRDRYRFDSVTLVRARCHEQRTRRVPIKDLRGLKVIRRSFFSSCSRERGNEPTRSRVANTARNIAREPSRDESERLGIGKRKKGHRPLAAWTAGRGRISGSPRSLDTTAAGSAKRAVAAERVERSRERERAGSSHDSRYKTILIGRTMRVDYGVGRCRGWTVDHDALCSLRPVKLFIVPRTLSFPLSFPRARAGVRPSVLLSVALQPSSLSLHPVLSSSTRPPPPSLLPSHVR